MRHRAVTLLLPWLVGAACAGDGPGQSPVAEPLVIGDSFVLHSTVLGEERRINVFRPTAWGDDIEGPLPVIYMPDGGMGEDFLHIAGLLQVSVSNGTMRPFLLVGMENTERARDMTGPSEDPRDAEIAEHVGGSAAFRGFIRTELMPAIRQRYSVTEESAVIGESLAGLFVVETFLREPDLFDAYVAVDPSLWWNRESLLETARDRLPAMGELHKTVFVASSDEPDISREVTELAHALSEMAGPGITWFHEAMRRESHGSIYHPAALNAFRTCFPPAVPEG